MSTAHDQLANLIADGVYMTVDGMIKKAEKEWEMELSEEVKDGLLECVTLLIPSFLEKYGEKLEEGGLQSVQFWLPFTELTRDLLLTMMDKEIVGPTSFH